MYTRLAVLLFVLLIFPAPCSANNGLDNNATARIVDFEVVEDLHELLGAKLRPIYYGNDINEVVRVIDSELIDEIDSLQMRLDSILVITNEIGIGVYDHCNVPQLMVHTTGIKNILSDISRCGSECGENEYNDMQFGLLYYANQLAGYIMQCHN